MALPVEGKGPQGAVGKQPGHPEIKHLDDVVGPHEQVLGLDVTVDDPGRMRCLQGPRHLADPAQQLGQRWASVHPRPQGVPLDEFHDQERLALVFLQGVNGADVRVVQGRGGPGLAAKAIQGLGVLAARAVQDLEGHQPPQLVVLGLVDDAHAAAAQLAQDFVPRQHGRRGPFGQGRDRAGQPVRFPVRIDGVVVGDLRDFCPAMAVVKVQHDQLAGQNGPRGLLDAFEIIADPGAQATLAGRLEAIAHRIEALGHGQGQGRDVRARE